MLTLVAVGYRYREPLQAKWTQLAFERRCLNYTAPADRVIYTDDPKEFAGLLGMVSQSYGGRYRERLEFVNFYPDVWVQHPLLKWEPGPAFLHRLKNARGETRLVGLDLGPMIQPTGQKALWFYPRVIIPAGLTTNASPANTSASYARLPADRQLLLALGLSAGNLDTVRIFAGQPDPDDLSHFTVRLEVNSMPEILDGWLQDDDLVLLKPRGRETYPGDEVSLMWRPAGATNDAPAHRL